ncbi:MAG TPA: hypothetical protein VFI65_20580 [Streptosporangiaceae bacterium]|nr:hypothetical protein [Streptosporangiaceae bacterium]
MRWRRRARPRRSPNPGQPGCGDDELLGVTASAAGTWAVGDACGKAIVLRLQGGQWKAVSTPSAPKGDSEQLSAVAAASASNAWAAGKADYPFGKTRMLIEKWNGTKWTLVTVQNPIP